MESERSDIDSDSINMTLERTDMDLECCYDLLEHRYEASKNSYVRLERAYMRFSVST